MRPDQKRGRRSAQQFLADFVGVAVAPYCHRSSRTASPVRSEPRQLREANPTARSLRRAACRGFLAVTCLAALAGCSPFNFSPTQASSLSREQLLKIADQEQADHLYYAGSDSSHHYLVDTRRGRNSAYKIEIQQLPLRDTFRLGEDSPYVLYPHMIEGELLGERPREIRGVTFDVPKRPERVRQ